MSSANRSFTVAGRRSRRAWTLLLAASAALQLAAGGHSHSEHGTAAAGRASAPMSYSHAERVGERNGAPLYRTRLVSASHQIDRIYRSMEGPITQTGFRLDPSAPAELLWMTGYSASILDANGEQPLPQEYMCHSSVATAPKAYRRVVPSSLGPREGRLFTLAQGQQELRLPAGFGIPFLSDQRLELQSQVLNHNDTDANFGVRVQISIEFVRDRELAEPLVPLTLTGASGLKALDADGAHFAMNSQDSKPETHGPGCSLGTPANEGHEFTDPLGQRFTGHWLVPPGREVNRTLVTNQLQLPYDTTLHYAAIHLHPFAESLTLRDLTTGQVVFRAAARSAQDRVALLEVEEISHRDGIPLFANHEYEIESVYDNPTADVHDAMAGAYLYVRIQDVAVKEMRRRAAGIQRQMPRRAPAAAAAR